MAANKLRKPHCFITQELVEPAERCGRGDVLILIRPCCQLVPPHPDVVQPTRWVQRVDLRSRGLGTAKQPGGNAVCQGS